MRKLRALANSNLPPRLSPALSVTLTLAPAPIFSSLGKWRGGLHVQPLLLQELGEHPSIRVLVLDVTPLAVSLAVGHDLLAQVDLQ